MSPGASRARKPLFLLSAVFSDRFLLRSRFQSVNKNAVFEFRMRMLTPS